MLDLGTLKIGVEVDDGSAKKQLSDIGAAVENTGEEANSKITQTSSKLKTLVKTVAAAAITKKLVDLGKSAVEAYAQFEQLEGGVKKIFGDETAKIVQANADRAFRTAGISANKYMEQVTSFSASLLQSVGGDTVKAAEIADMAIQDMADNANTYGTSIESIQNAYQGFAKQNYTMLDNLKLGYGGTKTEMERLLADAEKLTGVHYDISNLNDVYEAIHAIQGELNITGTTAKEASKTVEGSVNAAKAAWQNFLVSLGSGNEEQVRKATEQLGQTIVTAAKNVIPVAVNVFKGIGVAAVEAIEEAFDVDLSDEVGFVKDLADAVKDLFSWVIENKDVVIAGVAGVGAAFLTFKVATIINSATTAIKGMAAAQGILNGVLLANPIGIVVVAIGALVAAGVLLYKNWDKVKAKAQELWNKVSPIFDGLKEKWDALKKTVGKIVKAVVESKTVQTAITWVKTLIEWWDKLKNLAKKAITFVVKKSGEATPGLKGDSRGHRIGLREVPYDDYNAVLHKGESILTAGEVNQYKKYLNDRNKETSKKQEVINNNDNKKVYNLGDVTLDVSSLKDIPTIEDFIDMLVRAKQFA